MTPQQTSIDWSLTLMAVVIVAGLISLIAALG
jgi:hypothetical protein